MFELEKLLHKKRPKRQTYGGWLKYGKPCADHLGRVFPSVAARAAFYGVPPDRACNRMRSGWSLEEALTTPAVDVHCRAMWRKRRRDEKRKES